MAQLMEDSADGLRAHAADARHANQLVEWVVVIQLCDLLHTVLGGTDDAEGAECLLEWLSDFRTYA